MLCELSFTGTGAIGALTVPALFDRLRHRRGGGLSGESSTPRRVIGSSYRLSIWLGGFLRHEEIYRDGEGRSKRQRKGPAYPRTPAPHSRIAVSFHQLFLDGLLPSRARLRFAGSLTIRFVQ